jgi:hypothetical protein
MRGPPSTSWTILLECKLHFTDGETKSQSRKACFKPHSSIGARLRADGTQAPQPWVLAFAWTLQFSTMGTFSPNSGVTSCGCYEADSPKSKAGICSLALFSFLSHSNTSLFLECM